MSAASQTACSWISDARMYREATPEQLNIAGMRLAGFQDQLRFALSQMPDATDDEVAELRSAAVQLETVIRARLAELTGEDN